MSPSSPGRRQRDLPLEIEMLLAADMKLPSKPMRRLGQSALRVAAPKLVVRHHRAGPIVSASSTVTTARLARIVDLWRGGRRGAPRRALRATTANSTWAWNSMVSSAKQGSTSKSTGETSLRPGTSAAVSTATTPGAARTAARSSDEDAPCAIVGRGRRDVQRPGRLGHVVDIAGRAGDVLARQNRAGRLGA